MTRVRTDKSDIIQIDTKWFGFLLSVILALVGGIVYIVEARSIAVEAKARVEQIEMRLDKTETEFHAVQNGVDQIWQKLTE